MRESERDADGLLVIDNYLSRDEIGRIIGRKVFLGDLKHLHHRNEYFLDSKRGKSAAPLDDARSFGLHGVASLYFESGHLQSKKKTRRIKLFLFEHC